MKRLAVITTHPVQYNAPIFRLLATSSKVDLKVYYTWDASKDEVFDPGFGKIIRWDIPLLEGYEYEFLENRSSTNRVKSFWSIQNPTLIRDIKCFNPDAILIIGWKYLSHFQVMRYFKGKVPIYFRGDSTLLDDKRNIKTFFRRLILLWVYKHIDKAFYVGSQNKKYYLKHGLKEDQLIFAPHAIDNKRFSIENTDILKSSVLIRARLGIPDDHIVFLFTGKFEKKKNPLMLLKVFKKLKYRKINLLLVGNGVLEDELRKESEGILNIHFLSFQNQMQMPIIYKSADILILPSSGPAETWGLCINEAMASGLPIIASNKVGCAIDLVQEDINGFCFESDSEFGLQQALEKAIIKSKNGLNTMGESSIQIIANWSFDQICASISKEILSDNLVN